MRRLVAAALACAVVVGALEGAAGAGTKGRRPVAASTTTTTTWPPLPATSTAITWADCGNGFECGSLAVPVDWRAPTGEQFALALVRHVATAPDRRVGSLVVN